MTQRSLVNHSHNMLKIMLGLSLVHRQEFLFDQIVAQLGSSIEPFSPSFRQCKGDFNPQARLLLELALKACLVTADVYHTHTILQFSRDHNHLLSVDEQTVWYLVKQTQAGMVLDGDFSLISLVIYFDVVYVIQVNDANRNAVFDPYKGEVFGQILKDIVKGSDHRKSSKKMNNMGIDFAHMEENTEI